MQIKTLFILNIFGLLLYILMGISTFCFKISKKKLIKNIDGILPQLQCKKCGYSGCFPYAEAIIKKKEKINKCIPGGENVIFNISLLTNKNFEESQNFSEKKIFKVAWIDEKNCIGCTKCVKICPVDAIIGSNKQIHTVIKKFCTGCGLCISPCPTDCIKIKELTSKEINLYVK